MGRAQITQEVNTFLFDLDGTLLPMNAELFMKIYFHEMGKAFEGIEDSEALIQKVWAATHYMVKNTETRTNQSVFTEKFEELMSKDWESMQAIFEDFYKTGYLKTEQAVSKNQDIIDSVQILKQKGYQLVLATNPLFPKNAIMDRIRWAGIDVDDFIYISSYETNHFCKPQIHFYEEILRSIGKEGEACMMVGNDVQEDMVASQLNMKTYLITEHLINRQNQEFVVDYQGDYQAFRLYVEALPNV